jgi:hypothetical protein
MNFSISISVYQFFSMNFSLSIHFAIGENLQFSSLVVVGMWIDISVTELNETSMFHN